MKNFIFLSILFVLIFSGCVYYPAMPDSPTADAQEYEYLGSYTMGYSDGFITLEIEDDVFAIYKSIAVNDRYTDYKVGNDYIGQTSLFTMITRTKGVRGVLGDELLMSGKNKVQLAGYKLEGREWDLSRYYTFTLEIETDEDNIDDAEPDNDNLFDGDGSEPFKEKECDESYSARCLSSTQLSYCSEGDIKTTTCTQCKEGMCIDAIYDEPEDLDSHCFNGIYDPSNGEENIDCGGNCPACEKEEINECQEIRWSGYVYNDGTCYRQYVTACKNPFRYSSLEECQAANPEEQENTQADKLASYYLYNEYEDEGYILGALECNFKNFFTNPYGGQIVKNYCFSDVAVDIAGSNNAYATRAKYLTRPDQKIDWTSNCGPPTQVRTQITEATAGKMQLTSLDFDCSNNRPKSTQITRISCTFMNANQIESRTAHACFIEGDYFISRTSSADLYVYGEIGNKVIVESTCKDSQKYEVELTGNTKSLTFNCQEDLYPGTEKLSRINCIFLDSDKENTCKLDNGQSCSGVGECSIITRIGYASSMRLSAEGCYGPSNHNSEYEVKSSDEQGFYPFICNDNPSPSYKELVEQDFRCIFLNSKNSVNEQTCSFTDSWYRWTTPVYGYTFCRSSPKLDSESNRYCEIFDSKGLEGQTKTWTSTCSDQVIITKDSNEATEIVFDCSRASKHASFDVYQEPVTCIFEGTDLPQYCYSNDVYFGLPETKIGSSTFYAKADYGKEIVMESSCSLEKKTIIVDDKDDVVTFDCSGVDERGRITKDSKTFVKEVVIIDLVNLPQVSRAYVEGSDISFEISGYKRAIVSEELGKKLDWQTGCTQGIITTVQDGSEDVVRFYCDPAPDGRICIEGVNKLDPYGIPYECIGGEWVKKTF